MLIEVLEQKRVVAENLRRYVHRLAWRAVADRDDPLDRRRERDRREQRRDVVVARAAVCRPSVRLCSARRDLVAVERGA